MSMMGKIEAQELQWFAVRVKRKQVGGIGRATVGGEFEAYRDREGRVRKRRISGTGTRVFLPEHILKRAGFQVFLPVKKVMKRRNRFNPERICVSQPLLVDWMFVGWPVGERRWHQLMALDVVSGVMGTGGHPVAIPEARMLQLMRQWGGGQLDANLHQRVKAAQDLRPGDLARVVAGPLQDHDLRVVEVTGPSVKGLMALLGGEIPVEVRAELLQPAVR
ncbi:hypothetical protein KM176_05530 [Pseudooceanicola sp. CBS1P-1]|uniref:NusG-like N-terminal domain-containing protein n=1 Tax=Pseudooceanicola albus TaxID=2692189 RepID=A0A6L7FW73_9RHOB|nr:MULTISPECIES: transcription termination/antitermination NusG family protein [Pseudooceanicola]MBT9383313.1 hypothetical protein [Pseudooceanicola endophyticus]MXN16364.1 hypothetical protein [Pseudooceanicola albus]